jgi:hypothetical protein
VLSRSSARVRVATLLAGCAVVSLLAVAAAGVLHAPAQLRAIDSFRAVDDRQAEADPFDGFGLQVEVFRALRRALPVHAGYRLELAPDTAFDPVRAAAIRSLAAYWLLPRDSRGPTEAADAVVRVERDRVLIRRDGRVAELPSAFVGEGR